MPQISVIVPVYKVEPYLHRCVDSILAQTFTDFELILVDDGSPDNCGAICDEYAQKDSRVHVIHQENGGLSAARNAGIDWVFENSDSEWLTFVDSDDWIHPRMLEQLYHAVLEYNVEVSICGYEETGEDNRWTNAVAAQVKLWPVEQFYVEHNVNATVAWGKLYARACFADIRYPVGKIYEDEYVTYRILFQFEQVAVIDVPMYAYFVNPEGITKSEWTVKRLDKLDALIEQISFFEGSGLECALRRRIISLALFIVEQRNTMKQAAYSHVNKHEFAMMRNCMPYMIIKHHALFPFVEENYWIYEIAFPRLMEFFWLICALKSKISGKKN